MNLFIHFWKRFTGHWWTFVVSQPPHQLLSFLQWFCFQKYINNLWGTFTQKTLFLIIDMTNVQGDLTDVPNRTPTLAVSVFVLADVPVWSPGTMCTFTIDRYSHRIEIACTDCVKFWKQNHCLWLAGEYYIPTRQSVPSERRVLLSYNQSIILWIKVSNEHFMLCWNLIDGVFAAPSSYPSGPGVRQPPPPSIVPVSGASSSLYVHHRFRFRCKV